MGAAHSDWPRAPISSNRERRSKSFTRAGLVAAVKAAGEAGVAALRAEALLMEAHGQALSGDERASLSALDKALSAFTQAEREALPRWMSYFDEAYYAAKSAHCLLALGRLREAGEQAQRSLNMDEAYVRGRSFNLALLSLVAARQGEVEQAVDAGLRAVQLRSSVDS